ncbi:PREDICTED: uncharacterized protein LOC103333204 [Prunus mume]|uniref:Uncharacterized protein LOC103333204 n=1 Tax=Prunus mume TaxID=102107 RepID=A0ABM0P4D6_PRUMU|nr:PREDICTED: uncharacterized protein LOC103333204 [Prunus mume]
MGCRIVDLPTSTIKMDAEDSDLRLCFRITSPLKTYTLQATKRQFWKHNGRKEITLLRKTREKATRLGTNISRDFRERGSTFSLESLSFPSSSSELLAVPPPFGVASLPPLVWPLRHPPVWPLPFFAFV